MCCCFAALGLPLDLEIGKRSSTSTTSLDSLSFVGLQGYVLYGYTSARCLYLVDRSWYIVHIVGNFLFSMLRTLQQASRSWNQRFDKVIKTFGFIQTYGEACIYNKVSESSVAFLILYVDDILLIGNDVDLLNSVKDYLNNSFSMKDLGEAAYILGIKIYRDRSRCLLSLSQSTY